MPFLLRNCLVTLLAPYALIALVSCGGGGEDSGASLSNATAAFAQGGFVEKAGSAIRPRWTADQLQTFLPSGRGKFTFPAPYNTEAMRVTTTSDCGGDDCVWNVGYSYWRNMNNHVGSNQMLIFLGLNRNRGGGGPTLFRYDKTTEEISNLGPLFDENNRLSGSNAAGWYFSATLATKMYVNNGPRALRYDVMTKESEVVYDVSGQFGANRDVWQMSSSNDDRVHAATLRATSTGEYLGCLVYFEPSRQFAYYPKVGQFDECHVDRSGRYLLILEQLDGQNGLDNRYIDLQTGGEERVLNLHGVGSVGHLDMGYGYVVGHDGYNPMPNATLTWSYGASMKRGPVVHQDYNWDLGQVNHVSHTNAKAGVPMEKQYACGSNADRVSYAQNEILCFRLDGSLEQLVVAPVMTNLDASGGGDDYSKAPKGNLDVTGQYFIWTTNMGGGRLDAFIVKVPGQLLGGS
jgi:hypothetical protein